MDEVFGVVAATVICGGILIIIAALMAWIVMGIVSGIRGTARRMANHQCCDHYSHGVGAEYEPPLMALEDY